MTERTADDHWDLASSVGATATMVAASRALASRAADPLIDDPFAEALVRAVGLPYFVKLLDAEVPVRAVRAQELADGLRAAGADATVGLLVSARGAGHRVDPRRRVGHR
mgnify:CR=1 FL=1